MTDGLSKFIGIFIAVLLLFIYPMLHMADHQEESARILVLNAVTKYVDSVRDKGYVDQEMYDAFLLELAVTGPAYDVNMTHRHQVFIPIYGDITDPSSFTGEVEVIYEGYFHDEIVQALEVSGVYYMSKDDYFDVEVVNSTSTMATKIKSFVFGRALDTASIYVSFGGQVRYENH